jgi:hypothetical protein
MSLLQNLILILLLNLLFYAVIYYEKDSLIAWAWTWTWKELINQLISILLIRQTNQIERIKVVSGLLVFFWRYFFIGWICTYISINKNNENIFEDSYFEIY